MTTVRGVRGAVSVEEDTPEEVQTATRRLLEEILERNGIREFDEIASAIFTTTPDLTSCFPARAAREIGMDQVPLLCASEIDVDGDQPRIIRILLHLNTDKLQKDIVHVYLGRAATLRPDCHSAQ